MKFCAVLASSLVLWASAGAAHAGPPLAPSPMNFVQLTLTEMGLGYGAQGPQWDKVQQAAIDSAGQARTIEQTYPALRAALAVAGGAGSHFCPQGQCPWLQARNKPPAVLPSGSTRDGVTSVRITSMSAQGKDDQIRYMHTLGRLIEQSAPHTTRGWIVDLRGVGGENPWPIIAGLNALLDDGPLVSYHSNKPHLTFPTTTLHRGVLTINPQKHYTLTRLPVKNTLPIALLLDNKTEAAGETVAIAFAGQHNVKSFGTPTAGLTSDSIEYQLPFNRGSMSVTAYLEGDKTGHIYGTRISPNSITSHPEPAAQRWLGTK